MMPTQEHNSPHVRAAAEVPQTPAWAAELTELVQSAPWALNGAPTALPDCAGAVGNLVTWYAHARRHPDTRETTQGPHRGDYVDHKPKFPTYTLRHGWPGGGCSGGPDFNWKPLPHSSHYGGSDVYSDISTARCAAHANRLGANSSPPADGDWGIITHERQHLWCAVKQCATRPGWHQSKTPAFSDWTF